MGQVIQMAAGRARGVDKVVNDVKLAVVAVMRWRRRYRITR